MPQYACLCDPCSSKSESMRCALCNALVVSKVGGAPPPAPLCASHAKSASAKNCYLCRVRPAGTVAARICRACAATATGQTCVICKSGIDFGDISKLLGGFRP